LPAAGFVIFFAAAALAQQAQISGLVKDASGAAVENAAVELRNTATNQRIPAKTNGEGIYSIVLQRPGSYDLSVEAKGFEKAIVENLKLEVAAKVTQDVQLQVSGTTQNVTVAANGIQLNTVDAAVSTVVNRQFVENMPLNGRSFQSLLTL